MNSNLITPDGRVRLFDVIGDEWRVRGPAMRNAVLYDWSSVVGSLLAGDPAYALNAVYLEYRNTSSAIAVPSVSRGDGRSYYNGLSASPDTDFLRVPLTTRTVLTEGSPPFSPVRGNVLRIFAMSSGTSGIHGKPFTSGANSTVFALAVAATPVAADRSQDIVFARIGIPTASQIKVEGTKKVGIEWSFTFQ
jgi:hypothetical protein